jgi:DNA invertase Pin-like site-specific DNA recombinase
MTQSVHDEDSDLRQGNHQGRTTGHRRPVAPASGVCDTQGWTVVHDYVDRASGKRGDRDQFQKMFVAASRREFDCLLFWSLDRLSQEGTVETLNHLQRLTNYGVNYRSFTEQYLDSTGVFREAVVGILAAVAKQERVRLSERTIAGLERAKAQGRVGGRPKAEDAEPKLVAQIARLRSQEHSIRAIAAELGKSPNTIMRLLKLEEACV